MNSYLDLVKTCLEKGRIKKNRTGTSALTISGYMLQHDMKMGFPLLTTKKMPFKSIKVELEFFIKGLTDKKWLQDRGCTIWDEWCNPEKIPHDLKTDQERKNYQLQEQDLGKIYGYQWRNFNGSGNDQLAKAVDTLKRDPDNRRMIVSAWNPVHLHEMALPPCHILFHLNVIDGELNLTWFQRSCDVMLGIPFNLASYAVLLHLLAKEANLKEGMVTGMLSDVHIYENHIDGAKVQISRQPKTLPTIETNSFTDIFSWEYSHTKLTGYESDEKINFEVTV